jgi:hypothetical protein
MILTIVFIILTIFTILCSVLGIWAIFKFGKSYKYERDDPFATLPKGLGVFELLSPKCKKGILNTNSEDLPGKNDK